MIYTFTISGRPKAIKANSMSDALSKIIDRYLMSFLGNKINYISSNDPDAPKEEMLVYTQSLYDYTRMTPVTQINQQANK